jgi:hypothetical protein
LCFVGVLCALSAVVPAQNLTSRSTTLNYQATYGGGGDAFTPSDLVTDSQLLTSDNDSLAFQDTRAGFVNNDPFRPWGAGVGVDMVQGYLIDGPLGSFTRIQSSGSTSVAASSSGEGLASIGALNPGNELRFDFTLATARQARISGNVSLLPDGQNLHAGVALQRFDGIVWAYVFNSLFLPGQEGVFDNQLNLAAGDYRLTAFASGDAFHVVRPTQDNAWNYDLQVVPEPGAMATLGLGLAALFGRRKSA